MTPRPQNVIRPVRVFVASPSDVGAERQAVRELVDELNLPLRRHGWYIDVLGWEDRGPTGGRAQADINQDVERSDIFVGILWQRWGMATGASSSGFAEEWSLARERFERSGAPDLWLYFKSIHTGLTSRETSQVEAVNAFRREIEESEVAFYKTFEDEADFARLVRERLLHAVLDRSGLTRTDIGVLAIDWGTAYREDPVWLIAGGGDRQTLATELLESSPRDAASILVELGDALETLGLPGNADDVRMKACQALLAADDAHAAVDLLRAILGQNIWWMRLSEVDRLLRGLGDDWPPEIARELVIWRACCRAVHQPA